MHRILVVEDSPTQAEHLRAILMADGFDPVVAVDGQAGLDCFLASPPDLLITDVLMPRLSGYDLCRRIKEGTVGRDVPVVILTTLNNPLDIVQAIEAGADNFITKPFRPDALIGRLRYIFNNKARRASGRLRVGLDVAFLGKTFTITSEKEQILDLLISTCEDIVRVNRDLRTSQAQLAIAKEELERHNAELRLAKQDLEKRVRDRTADLVQVNEALRREARERQEAQAALFREREFLKAVLENVQEGIVACDSAGVLRFCNHAARELQVDARACETAAEWAERCPLYQADSAAPAAPAERPLMRALCGERLRDVEFGLAPQTAAARTLWVSAQPISGTGGETMGAVAVMHDVTERVRLERQLRQSQKMEAVGRLAAGIAHDFNNLLTVIGGYSEVLLSVPQWDERFGWMVGEIHRAGARAAALTRQLLTFSRQQLVSPRILDLNTIIADVEKMLRRLIGEDVLLASVLEPTLGRVKADPGQMEQILVNLAVNACDAMPTGGRLTIETSNVELDEAYTRARADVQPGRYVLLAVSDTGCGMDEATRARVFEPFFTTKELGKGTGLGLATVYGIVKQGNGHIAVYSEPGRGTTLKVYLPRVESTLSPSNETMPTSRLRGTETLLLVEDEEAVRTLTREILQMQGYHVLEARDGSDALRVSEAFDGTIGLLVTDVVMPGIGGRQLADRLVALRPGVRVLFVSGYTNDAVVRHGVLEAETPFLQKPFTVEELTRKVREVLERPGLPPQPRPVAADASSGV